MLGRALVQLSLVYLEGRSLYEVVDVNLVVCIPAHIINRNWDHVRAGQITLGWNIA